MELKGLPNRPIRLHEVTVVNKNDSINNIEPVFYEGNNINGAICILINIGGVANIIGFDPNESEWIVLSKVSSEEDKTSYVNESDSIIDWIEDKYGEDGYGIYGDDEI